LLASRFIGALIHPCCKSARGEILRLPHGGASKPSGPLPGRPIYSSSLCALCAPLCLAAQNRFVARPSWPWSHGLPARALPARCQCSCSAKHVPCPLIRPKLSRLSLISASSHLLIFSLCPPPVPARRGAPLWLYSSCLSFLVANLIISVNICHRKQN